MIFASVMIIQGLVMRNKIWWILVLSCLLTVCGAALGEVRSGKCGDDLRWTLDDEGLLVISGSGSMTSHPWNMGQNDSVKKVIVQEGCTELADFAFAQLPNLTEVSLPETLKVIGRYTFSSCSGLESIVLPEGLTSIDSYCFSHSGLRNIRIPQSISMIPEQCFAGCKNLESVEIQSGCTRIGPSAFSSCPLLKNVSIPDTVTEIGQAAFAGCTGLESIVLPDSITFIPSYCFSGSGIKRIVLPKTLEIIGNNVFERCPKLEEIIIPESVTILMRAAFLQCGNLKKVTILGNITSMGDNCFSYCENLERAEILGTVPVIGESAFDHCTNLRTVILSDRVAELGVRAFASCTSLEQITIPEGVQTIGRRCFDNTGLWNVVIPSSVTLIDIDAFQDCRYLTSVCFLGKKLIIAEKFINFDEHPIIFYCYSDSDPFHYANYHHQQKVLLDNVPFTVCLNGEIKLTEGSEIPAPYSVFPSDPGLPLSWESGDPSVFTVDSRGMITAVSAGTASITVTCGNQRATSQVSVFRRAEDFILPDPFFALSTSFISVYYAPPRTIPEDALADFEYSFHDYEGFKYKHFTLLSRIKKDGSFSLGIDEESPCTVKMTVTDRNSGIRKTVTVVVCSQVSAIQLEPDSIRLPLHGKASLRAIVSMGENQCENQLVTFSSGNTQVVEVDQNTGVITAKGPGTAEIYVQSKRGAYNIPVVTAVCTVTVVDSVTLPAGITSVEAETFYGTSAFGYYLPNGVTDIGSQAFGHLSGERIMIRIPDSVKSIATDAFDGSDVVFLLPADSYARRWADDRGIPWTAE